MENTIDLIETITTLEETFLETSDMDYLDTAIGLAEDAIACVNLTAPPVMFNFILGRLLVRKVLVTGAPKNMETEEPDAKTCPIPVDTKEVIETVETLEKTFLETGDIDYMDTAIGLTETAIETTPSGTGSDILHSNLERLRERKDHTSELVDELEIVHSLKDLYIETGDIDHLTKAIGLVTRLINNRSQQEHMKTLHSVLRSLFDLQQQKLDNRPPAYDQTSGGAFYSSRALESNSTLSVLLEVIDDTWEVVVSLKMQFSGTGDIECLSNAIGLAEDILPIIPLGSRRDNFQQLLSSMMATKFGARSTGCEVTESAEELLHLLQMLMVRNEHVRLTDGITTYVNDTIERAEKILSMNCPDEVRKITECAWAKMMQLKAETLTIRYQKTGNAENLAQAFKAIEAAMAVPSTSYYNNGLTLLTCSKVWYLKFSQSKVFADLDKAIEMGEKSISARPLHCPSRPGMLNNLAAYLSKRFDELRDQEDIEKAIELCEQALIESSEQSEKCIILSTLSSMYSSRHTQSGNPGDIDKALEIIQQALNAAAPSSHMQSLLYNMSRRLNDKFQQSGNLKYLDAAIQMSSDALMAVSHEQALRSLNMHGLSSSLMDRYDRLGAVADLEKAVALAREALAASPVHYDQIGRIENLTRALQTRWKHFGTVDDLQEALELSRVFLGHLPGGPSRYWSICSVAILYFKKSFKFRDIGDLQIAIKVQEECLAAIPLNHFNRPVFITNMSCLLGSRFMFLGDPEDLNRAIQILEENLLAKPEGTGVRSTAMMALATFLYIRVGRLGATFDVYFRTDTIRLIEVSLECLSDPTYPPHKRIFAARLAARHLGSYGLWGKASSILTDAIKILPQFSPQHLGRNDKEHQLSIFAGLATEAASISLAANLTASDCVALLELGRGVIMGFTIDCRSDLSELQEMHLDLFHKYNLLRTQIDTPVKSGGVIETGQFMSEIVRRRRVEVIDEIDRVLCSIRQLTGFQNFQLPPTSRDLMKIALEGPIVIFNTTEFRSDALIVTATDIRSLPLPDLKYSEVEERMGKLTHLPCGKRSTYRARNEEMADTLLWLWETAVGPVLDNLGLHGVVEDYASGGLDIPRVWWIGGGPLAMAPFHAAGDHSIGSTRNTISRAISSHIPTIKALSYARERSLDVLDNPHSKVLLVSMPTTPDTPETVTPPVSRTLSSVDLSWLTAPGADESESITGGARGGNGAKRWGSLQNATKEVQDIVDIVMTGSRTVTRLDSPCAADVLQELPNYHVIHFACHGVSDKMSPSNSHLILHGQDRSKPGIVTVGDIAAMNIQNAQIAYLSACSTAQNESVELADESIHIASGFQLAGFSHVLATQWKSDDNACRLVARGFYSNLFKSNAATGHRAVSTAFHHAVTAVRQNLLRQPIKWASFVHTGA